MTIHAGLFDLSDRVAVVTAAARSEQCLDRDKSEQLSERSEVVARSFDENTTNPPTEIGAEVRAITREEMRSAGSNSREKNRPVLFRQVRRNRHAAGCHVRNDL